VKTEEKNAKHGGIGQDPRLPSNGRAKKGGTIEGPRKKSVSHHKKAVRRGDQNGGKAWSTKPSSKKKTEIQIEKKRAGSGVEPGGENNGNQRGGEEFTTASGGSKLEVEQKRGVHLKGETAEKLQQNQLGGGGLKQER